jgi:3-dehydroquinate dehydratase
VVAPKATGQITGFGPLSYYLAVEAAAELLKS